MYTAKCTEDQIAYSAIEFSYLQPTELDRKRRFLRCPECGGPAFFRNGSRNGRAPCFGARPHSVSCGQAAQDYERSPSNLEDGPPVLAHADNRIVLDFNFGAQIRPENADVSGMAPISRRPAHFGCHLNRPGARILRRLSSVLRALIEFPTFGQSGQIIEIPQMGDTTACDFFVPLLATTTNYAGLFRGYWGMLSDARFAGDGALWLNSGGQDNISFCITAELVEEFGHRFATEDEEDLAGAYVLVIGEPQIARNGKLFRVVDDLSKIALRLT